MRIFISHSSKDRDVTELFVTLLTNALRINPEDIFCSSLDGHKIESGKDWRGEIKYNINNSKICFIMISPDYKKSEICLNEMGAIYFTENIRHVPLIIPPATNEDAGVLFETTQIEYLQEEASLERIKDIVTGGDNVNIKGDYWDKHKKEFIKKISMIYNIVSAINPRNEESIDDNERYERGYYSDYIADSTISHHNKVSNIDLLNQLSMDLRNNKERLVDLKFNYLGSTSAANWISLSQHPSYGHSKLIAFFADNAEEIIAQMQLSSNQKIDLISLGSGDGVIDKHIILRLLANDNINFYYPFDISFELLQKVVNEISTSTWWKPKKIKIKAIHGDFFELVQYKQIFDHDSVPNLFSLLGFTFGNYNEAEFIGKIKEGMENGDFLLLDARLHDLELGEKLTADQKNTLINNYNNESTNRFVFGALEAVTNAEYKSVSFECVPKREITTVPNAINILINCKGINTNFRNDNKSYKKDSICLGMTTLYSYNDLINWLIRRGFQIVWSKKTTGTGMFLLKKY